MAVSERQWTFANVLLLYSPVGLVHIRDHFIYDTLRQGPDL